jgi:hypothetical protein
VNTVGGPHEKQRAEELFQRVYFNLVDVNIIIIIEI